MASTTVKVDHILTMANNYEFNNQDIYLSRQLFENYEHIPHYTLQDCLDHCHVSKQYLKKYLKELGYGNYRDFKNEISFEFIVRKKQFMDRYRLFDKDNAITIMNQFMEKPIDIHVIDKICDDIYHSQRVIFYGSPALLSLIHDFQLDMKVFYKTVITSSVTKDKYVHPKDQDMIVLCSATLRLFGVCDPQFKDNVLRSPHKKILFCQKTSQHVDVDYVLCTYTNNDYYEMHYVYLLYLDLIKTRYYEKYIKGKE